MKEGISYSFLLNIIIVFIFVCAAIIMGSLSYYKAFRANAIISQTIEKYEGYNCVAADEIARKLSGVGYTTPFSVNCNNKGKNCMTDAANTYAVVSYNLDEGMNNQKIVYKERTDEYKQYANMNSTYKCDYKGCVTNKKYQYGIYTYMYTELPVIQNLIRIPLFAKTSIMYEFRDFYVFTNSDNEKRYVDTSSFYDNLYKKTYIGNKVYVTDTRADWKNSNGTEQGSSGFLGTKILNMYSEASANSDKSKNYLQELALFITGKPSLDYRTRIITTRFLDDNGNLSAKSASSILGPTRPIQKCGYITDYSKVID